MEFQCIADRCRHSCCIGWEIDIDEDTFALYKAIPGTFGDYVRKNIATEEDGTHHFILDENDRCPFLNEKNLCELILNLGEESLCDICSEHPRFYVQVGDSYKMGYGLCCEEAARLCLFASEPASPDILDEIGKWKCFPDFPTKESFDEFLLFMSGLENLTTEWPKLLTECQSEIDSLAVTEPCWDFLRQPMAHLYEYLHFRYDDIGYCRRIWQLILGLCIFLYGKRGQLTEYDVIEVCRQYSAEVEYCEENVEAVTGYGIEIL